MCEQWIPGPSFSGGSGLIIWHEGCNVMTFQNVYQPDSLYRFLMCCYGKSTIDQHPTWDMYNNHLVELLVIIKCSIDWFSCFSLWLCQFQLLIPCNCIHLWVWCWIAEVCHPLVVCVSVMHNTSLCQTCKLRSSLHSVIEVKKVQRLCISRM